MHGGEELVVDGATDGRLRRRLHGRMRDDLTGDAPGVHVCYPPLRKRGEHVAHPRIAEELWDISVLRGAEVLFERYEGKRGGHFRDDVVSFDVTVAITRDK